MKNVTTIIAICIFAIVFWASGDETAENGRLTPGKITKDELCNKSFVDHSSIKSIGMEIKTRTTFNCDGTFKSGQDWNAQENAKEAYENTGISTSGQFEKDLTGTWEIITGNLPDDVSRYLRKYGYGKYIDEGRTTIIKYKSSNGISGYCQIYEMDISSKPIMLDVIFMDQISEQDYENDGVLGMWDGKLE